MAENIEFSRFNPIFYVGSLNKLYEDMTEISIWDYGNDDNENEELLEEFKRIHKDDLVEFSGEHGDLPGDIDEIVASTDETEDYIGRYYEAWIIIDGRLYNIEVQNGDDPMGYGELLIASMYLDESLNDEYQ